MPRKWDLVPTSNFWSSVVKLHYVCQHGRPECKFYCCNFFISRIVVASALSVLFSIRRHNDYYKGFKVTKTLTTVGCHYFYLTFSVLQESHPLNLRMKLTNTLRKKSNTFRNPHSLLAQIGIHKNCIQIVLTDQHKFNICSFVCMCMCNDEICDPFNIRA